MSLQSTMQQYMLKKIIYVDIKLLRLHVDHEVENSEKGKGKDVHEDQVEPGDVHIVVDGGEGDLHLGVDDVDVCVHGGRSVDCG